MKSAPQPSGWAKYVSEFLGTFFLVFTIGCNVHTGSIGAAISVGFILMAMVYALGDVSGAHFNPAVTLSVLASGRGKITAWDSFCYIVAQCIAAVAATLLYYVVVDVDHAAVAVQGVYTPASAFLVEAMYTWALCYVVLNVSTTKDKEQGNVPNAFFGLAIGFTITSSLIAIGPISSCGLNPAVTIASMFAAHLSPHAVSTVHFWGPGIFAPLLGAFLGAASFWLVQGGPAERYEYARGEWVPEQAEHERLEIERIAAEAAEKERQERLAREARAARLSPLIAERPVSPRVEQGTLVLEKLEPIDLPARMYDHDLSCSLGWRVKVGSGRAETIDMDLACAKFNRHGKSIGAVYFQTAKDSENGIELDEDSLAMGFAEEPRARFQVQEDGTETIRLRLSMIKPQVQTLFFVAGIHSAKQYFEDIDECSLRIVDHGKDGKAKGKDGKEYCRYTKADMGHEHNMVIVAMLYRKGDGWCFCAVDEPHTVRDNSTYRRLEPDMKRLCDALNQCKAAGLIEQP